MEIFFRVDASYKIGTGHVMRCLTLAEKLKSNGAEITFISRLHQGNLNELISKKNIKVIEMQESKAFGGEIIISNNDDYSEWLGVSQEQDAVESIKALGDKKPNWLIVDHYGLDSVWGEKIRPHVEKIMVIDDLANRNHHCDLLLDQNWFEDKDNRYLGLVPPFCKMLLGPEYALLRSEFSDARKKLKTGKRKVKRIFVFFGGSDPHNLTRLTLTALSEPELSHLIVDVVVGGNNIHVDELKELTSKRPQTNLYIQVNDIASIMAKSDMAIGSGGVNTWERICLGLYSLTISFADNHNVLLKDLEKNKFISHIGKNSDIDEMKIKKEILSSIRNIAPISKKNKLMTLLDGDGTEKVVESILKKSLKICFVTDKDSWINDYLNSYIKKLESKKHNVSWVHEIKKVIPGDICVLLGCGQYMEKQIRLKNKNNIVVHESALPQGKGWSPMTWQILEGKNSIPITLIEVGDKIDSGKIYFQKKMEFEGHELIEELRKVQAEKSFELCDLFINKYPESIKKGRKQKGESSFHRKRIESDCELEIDKPLSDNFNLLRTVDNKRYPAFFYYQNHRYKLEIEKF